MKAEHAITLVVTSCGRWDLLERTLASFLKHKAMPIAHAIITDDSGERLKVDTAGVVPWGKLTVIDGIPRVGQIASIDRAYALVKTPYVFHLEDDWEFYRTGFMKESLDRLEACPTVINHWLRERNDTNGHPVDGDRLRLGHNGRWHGFTFNPTLKRMRDYELIRSYGAVQAWTPRDPGYAESRIGERYHDLGYHATIAEKGYVRHIGEGRHVQ